MSLKFQKNIVNVKSWIPHVDRKNAVKLDLNENYAMLDSYCLKKLIKFDNFTISCYPEYGKLVALISKYTKQKTDNIIITNGAEQAIELVLALFFSKKNRIVIPSPVFFRYDSVLSLLGAKVKHVFYNKEKNGFSFPISETLKALESSDGVILCNPNNPLGSPIDNNDILKILKKSKELNIPCIIDEAYFEFYGKTSVKLINKFSNLIIIRTFSKMFGLAGLRLGYVIANRDIIKQLVKIRSPRSVNHFAVKAGETVLQDIKYFKNRLKDVLKIKKDLIIFLKAKGFKVYNTSTNFILINHDKSSDLLKKLKEKNILVNNISDYPFSNSILRDVIRMTLPSANDFIFLKRFFNHYKK